MKKYLKPIIKEIKVEAIDVIATSITPFLKGNDAPSAGQTEYKVQWTELLEK